jgi:hypothetical protein
MATSFHDHFESNGWRVGGRTPMKNWQAGLRQWRARQEQFEIDRAMREKPPAGGRR